jgi:hypothetical protein
LLNWGDTHHPALSMTDFEYDGEWLFGSGRIDHGGRWEMTVAPPKGVKLACFEVEVAP